MDMRKRIILGSASPRRKELLEQIGIEFEIVVSSKEESYQSTEPEEIVKELALMKAENVAEELARKEKGSQDLRENDCTETVLVSGGDETVGGYLRNVLILGADTIVVRDGEILGKPSDEEAAFHMLGSLPGKMHQVYTGVAMLDFNGNGERQAVCHVEETKVYVHEMTEEEIRRYLAAGESMDKAGAYGVQGKFAAYIDRIEGDYYNVVGLPVAYVYQKMKEFLL